MPRDTSSDVNDYERTWLSELERRIAADLPIDEREMMVKLRAQLPRGFTPADVDHSLYSSSGLRVRGLMVLGDHNGLLPDLEKLILYIRDRIVRDSSASRFTADELSASLELSAPRVQRLLGLLADVGSFYGSAGGSKHGYSYIDVTDPAHVAALLAFTDVKTALAEREQQSEALRRRLEIEPAGTEDDVVRNSAFVLMNMNPSDPTLTDVLQAIKEECRRFGITALRVDEIQHSDRITDLVLQKIAESEFLIADLTGERPNVYYEVGFAHALHKRPILFRKAGTLLHFDLSVHNVPEYKNVTELRSLLSARLAAILGRDPASP
jgi:hypothetical protein